MSISHLTMCIFSYKTFIKKCCNSLKATDWSPEVNKLTISRPEEVLLKEVENLALALEGKSLGYTFGLKVEFDLEDPVFFPPYSDR